MEETSDNSAAANSEEDAKNAEPDLPLVDFGVVVAGKEHFDVCRLFLASLQLVSDDGLHVRLDQPLGTAYTLGPTSFVGSRLNIS